MDTSSRSIRFSYYYTLLRYHVRSHITLLSRGHTRYRHLRTCTVRPVRTQYTLNAERDVTLADNSGGASVVSVVFIPVPKRCVQCTTYYTSDIRLIYRKTCIHTSIRTYILLCIYTLCTTKLVVETDQEIGFLRFLHETTKKKKILSAAAYRINIFLCT